MEVIIDEKGLLKMFDNDRDFVNELLKEFETDVRRLAKELKSTSETGDYETTQKVCHTLKGTSSSLFMKPLSNASSDLEKHILLSNSKIVKSDVDDKVSVILLEIQKVLHAVSKSA